MPKPSDAVFEDITQDAIRRMAAAPNARLREVMSIVIRHLHDAVREAALSEEEWAGAVEFLKRTGRMCTDTRQEFILLSDVLGVSMLVDSINHQGADGATESTVFGPFYSGLQPVLSTGASILKREEPGERLTFAGRVLSSDGRPIPGALIEVWQTAPNGLYDVQDSEQPPGHLRASFNTERDGGYRFETVQPVSYAIPSDGPVGRLLEQVGRHPNRPAHIHFMISAPGHRRLITHLFIAGDPYLASDAVFGVKPSLIVTPVRTAGGDLQVSHDFGLLVVRGSPLD
jgi:protocatechuate 3,4-dioxygenase beta subunit